MSDPRLEGTAYETWEADSYAMPGAESGANVAALTFRIENEAGAWETRGYGGGFSDGTSIEVTFPTVLIGVGAYEGLIAIMESTNLEGACGDEVRGVIFEGAPVPEPYIP
jgi:hypothetical protein